MGPRATRHDDLGSDGIKIGGEYNQSQEWGTTTENLFLRCKRNILQSQ